MISLLLTACGGGAEGGSGADELALIIRGEYLAAAGCACRMEVTADYGQRVYTYTLDAESDGEETVVTVAAPEEAAGITARVAGTDSWLEYDGTVLETGDLTGDGLSPLGAVPALLESARSGFMDSCTLEPLGELDTLRVLCRDPVSNPGEGLETTLWFDAASHALVRGEIAQDGCRVILCEFSSFSLT